MSIEPGPWFTGHAFTQNEERDDAENLNSDERIPSLSGNYCFQRPKYACKEIEERDHAPQFVVESGDGELDGSSGFTGPYRLTKSGCNNKCYSKRYIVFVVVVLPQVTMFLIKEIAAMHPSGFKENFVDLSIFDVANM